MNGTAVKQKKNKQPAPRATATRRPRVLTEKPIYVYWRYRNGDGLPAAWSNRHLDGGRGLTECGQPLEEGGPDHKCMILRTTHPSKLTKLPVCRTCERRRRKALLLAAARARARSEEGEAP